MNKKVVTNLGALLLAALVGAIMMPGCELRIRRGNGQGAPGEPDPAEGGGVVSDGSGAGGGDASGSDAVTPEQQAAIEALQRADPEQLALTNAKAGYTAYALSALVESQVADPSALDPATLNQLVETYLPQAQAAAEQWVASLDPAALSSLPVTVKPECKTEFDCPYWVSCDFASTCLLTDCGDAKCKMCPDLWDLGHLIFNSWCTYTCMVGEDVAGYALVLMSRIGNYPNRRLCKANN